MTWRRNCTLVVLMAALQMGRLQGRLHHPYQIQQKKGRDRQRLISLSEPRRRKLNTEEVLLEPKIELNDQTEMAINNHCVKAQEIVPEDLIRGNADLATVDDDDLVKQCVNTQHPGVWYKTSGTGGLLRASLVQDNQTAIAVFQGSDCDSLACANVKIPILTASSAKTGNGWTTYFETEVNTTYFLYVYGMGSFQMILTEQPRPENDHSGGALKLEIGDTIEGSTAFASAESTITMCDR